MWIVVFFPSFFARPYEVDNIVIKPPRKEGGTYCTDDADVIEETFGLTCSLSLTPAVLMTLRMSGPVGSIYSDFSGGQHASEVPNITRRRSSRAAGRQARPRPGLQDTCAHLC